jgi:hydrogenase expression/formation protein HypD
MTNCACQSSLRNNRAAVKQLVSEIKSRLEVLPADVKPLRIMEVCGTHTMSIHRYGIKGLLPDSLRLISGPGCPVCVTGGAYIDTAIALAGQGVRILSFGDLLKVPALSGRTLAEARSSGAEVEVCISVFDALEAARKETDKQMVFLAVGFETTAAPVLTLLEAVVKSGLQNLSFLCDFKRVMPALEALSVDAGVNAFLCPGHVSAIIGADAYSGFVQKYHIPCAIAGFEPLDIIHGLHALAGMLQKGEAGLVNCYERVVKPGGNLKALALFERYLSVTDAYWRGIGFIPGSGFGLHESFSAYDAEKRFSQAVSHNLDRESSCAGCDSSGTCGVQEGAEAQCGFVLRGLKEPVDCPLFGTVCTPHNPVGPLMVSSEGSCAAFFRYGS